jgi:hypothetical protein
MKCIALRHSGQVGGAGSGWFSAITLTLDSGASTTELTVAGDAGGRAAIAEIRAGSIWLQEFWHSCVVTMADGQVIYENIFVMH